MDIKTTITGVEFRDSNEKIIAKYFPGTGKVRDTEGLTKKQLIEISEILQEKDLDQLIRSYREKTSKNSA